MSLTPSIPIKSSSAPAPAPPSTAPSTSTPFDSARRQTQSPSNPPSAPRKGQASRKQHRPSQKRATPSSARLDYDEDDAMAELRAVRNASSRRGQTSITHLLSYTPLPHYDSHHTASSRSYRRNPTWGGRGSSGVDKARYVHANYRFVVSPGGSYTSQAVDADEHLEWNDVLQIIASAESQQTSCPICLSEPVAPRMAKCGHIFCLPCLLRFMNSHDGTAEKKQNRWRRCPICEVEVFLAEVKPVRFYAGQESPLPRPGDDVILRLMMRNAKSTLALPREGGAEVLNSGEDIPWHFAANVLDYARIIKGTGGYMEEEFDREVEDLLRQEKEDELMFHQDNEWTQKAIRAVQAAKEKVKGLGEVESAGSERGAGKGKQGEMDFYFYASAPHLYLSPLDIRILKTRYGSFSAFPSTLLPRVEHISTGHVVDDALRRRAKYLSHLPYGCLISFLECDWTDIIPAEILAPFSEEIERRRKRNRDKAAQEERERVQAERLEAAALRGSRRNYGLGDEEVMVRFGNSLLPDEKPIDLNEFVPLGAEASTTPPQPRVGFGVLEGVSTSPSGRKTVWGTRAIVGEDGEEIVERRDVNDGWLGDDKVLETLGAADIAFQMEALGVEGGESSSGPGVGPGTGGGGGAGKKKKKQKITLMSTGGRRGF